MGMFVQTIGVVIGRFVAGVEDGVAPKQIYGHALNSRDVDDCMAWLWSEPVISRQHRGVEALLGVVTLKALAVDLVQLVELQSRLRLK